MLRLAGVVAYGDCSPATMLSVVLPPCLLHATRYARYAIFCLSRRFCLHYMLRRHERRYFLRVYATCCYAAAMRGH